MKKPRQRPKRNRKLSSSFNITRSESEKDLSVNPEGGFTGQTPDALRRSDCLSSASSDDAATKGHETPKKEKNGKSSSSDSKSNNITRGTKKGISAGPTTSSTNYGPAYIITDPHPAAYERHAQRMLEISCLRLRMSCYYGPEEEQKTCIWSGGDPFSWTEKSSGISWIGVNGTDTVCVVSSSEQDVLRWRPYGRCQMSVRGVHCIAVANMGVWADTSTPSTEFRRRMAQSSKAGGPFAVVSVAPDTVVDDHHPEISHECQQQDSRAINFLEAKLKDCSSLSLKETTQIAICALKYLLGQKFKSNEIESFGSGMSNGIRSPREVNEHLAAMDLTTSFSSLSVSS